MLAPISWGLSYLLIPFTNLPSSVRNSYSIVIPLLPLAGEHFVISETAGVPSATNLRPARSCTGSIIPSAASMSIPISGKRSDNEVAEYFPGRRVIHFGILEEDPE